MRPAVSILTAALLYGASCNEQNEKCGKSFEIDLALFIDANLTESQFDRQKMVFREVLKWLPDVGSKVRVTIVPYSWKKNNPINRLSGNLTQKRALDYLRYFPTV